MLTARLLTVFLGCISAVLALHESPKEQGDECLAASGDNPAWACEVPEKCPNGLKLMEAGNAPPESRRCGFQGMTQLICCPPYEISDWQSVDPISSGSDSSRRQTRSATRTSSKAAEMCREYSKIAATDCDKKTKRVKRIVGGTNAGGKEFPQMALIGFGSPPKYVCGGTLISNKYVLTAAHCEKHPRLGFPSVVLLGELDQNSTDDDAATKVFDVVGRIVHPGYKTPSTYNDVMLLRLGKAVEFSQYIRPLCLHLTKEINSPGGVAIGWGQLTHLGKSSSKLQKVQLPFVAHEKCNNSYKKYIGSTIPIGIKDDIQLCAGGVRNQDTCAGDAGGPLQIPHPEFACMYSQVGVVSFGVKCGGDDPGVYSRVSAYVPWIEEIVWG